VAKADGHGVGRTSDARIAEADAQIVGEQAIVGLPVIAPALNDSVELVIVAVGIGDAEFLPRIRVRVVLDPPNGVSGAQFGVKSSA
jgi:hypothetical protein